MHQNSLHNADTRILVNISSDHTLKVHVPAHYKLVGKLPHTVLRRLYLVSCRSLFLFAYKEVCIRAALIGVKLMWRETGVGERGE